MVDSIFRGLYLQHALKIALADSLEVIKQFHSDGNFISLGFLTTKGTFV